MSLPSQLGKYRIERVLGKGGVGIVYLGFDPVLTRYVAIKTPHSALLGDGENNEYMKRFLREAQAAAALSHPNIVTIHDYGEDHGTPYIAMELVDGLELKDILEKVGQQEPEEAIRMIQQVLHALSYCHAKGVIHRDLKPSNIMVLPNGSVKIADFGIARVESSDLTQDGALLGTPSYMSPEQIQGKRVDHRSDLYSIGVILYEVISGKKPLTGKTLVEQMHQVLNVTAEEVTHINPNLPATFNRLLSKALAKLPEDRFQSADEFADALSTLTPKTSGDTPYNDATVVLTRPGYSGSSLPNNATTANAPTDSSPQQQRSNGGKLILIAVIVLVLAGSGILSWLLWPSAPDQKADSPDRATTESPAVPVGLGMPELLLEPGQVHVVTYPAGAEIWINDRLVGITPHRFELRPGRHQAILKKDGYQDLRTLLEIEPDADIDFDLSLERRP